MGSPLQFDYLIQRLSGAYSIENLLLPGHGGTMRDFQKSSMTLWQSYVDERIRRLQKTHRNIVLVGHSMGCLLSVQAALSSPQQIRGLFLTAMPLKIHISVPYVRNSLMAAFSKNSSNALIAAARKLKSVSVSTPLEYPLAIPRCIELLNKCKITRGLIKELRLPVVVIQSENDEIVSGKSLRYVKEQQNIQAVIVRNAGHYYYPPDAQTQISHALEQFVVEVIAEDAS
jgi:carboxylesterase